MATFCDRFLLQPTGYTVVSQTPNQHVVSNALLGLPKHFPFPFSKMTSTTPLRPSPTILLQGLPPKTFIGIDLLSFNSSPSFQGIKDLPQGPHFLYTGTDASLSLRHGHWFHITPSSTKSLQILTFRWHPELECLELLPKSGEVELSLQIDPTRKWDPGVISYYDLANASGRQYESGSSSDSRKPGGGGQRWADLTSYITQGVLHRILRTLPEQSSDITAARPTSTSGSTQTISSASSAQNDIERIPGLSLTESKLDNEPLLNFLTIDLKRTWRDGAIGRERTESVLDRSWYLSHLMDSLSSTSNEGRKAGAAQILGELQFCFVAVLTLANWSCLQQWKRILALLLGCRKAVGEVQDYFVEVVRVLRLQLGSCEEVEGGLFEFTEEGSARWLKDLLSGFKAGVEDVLDGNGPLWEEIERLEDFMKDAYGWDYGGTMLKRGMLELEDGERVEMDMNEADKEDETGEYAPVVVDLG